MRRDEATAVVTSRRYDFARERSQVAAAAAASVFVGNTRELSAAASALPRFKIVIETSDETTKIAQPKKNETKLQFASCLLSAKKQIKNLQNTKSLFASVFRLFSGGAQSHLTICSRSKRPTTK